MDAYLAGIIIGKGIYIFFSCEIYWVGDVIRLGPWESEAKITLI